MYAQYKRCAMLTALAVVSYMLLCAVTDSDASYDGKELDLCSRTTHCHVIENRFSTTIHTTNSKGQFTTFCYRGFNYTLFGILAKATVHVFKVGQLLGVHKMTVYSGYSIKAVEQKAKERFFTIPILFTEEHNPRYKIVPNLHTSCILIDSDGDFGIEFYMHYIHIETLVVFLIGIMLFVFATPLSEGTKCHYIGVAVLSMIICSQVLGYLYITKKTKQRRTCGDLEEFLLCSTLLCLVAFATVVFFEAWIILFLYCILSGGIGSIFVYRYESVSDRRTINIMRWALQGIGLALIWLSVQHTAAGTTIGVLLVTNTMLEPLFQSEIPKRKQIQEKSAVKRPLKQLGISSRNDATKATTENNRSSLVQRKDYLEHFVKVPKDIRVAEFVHRYCTDVLEDGDRYGEDNERLVQLKIQHLNSLMKLAAVCRWEFVVKIHEDFMREIESGERTWDKGFIDIQNKFI